MRHRSSDAPQINARFLAIARDPRIVPALHRACDEWCDYCPLTERCPLFQCTREFQRARRRPLTLSGFRTAADAIEFARAFAAIDVPPAATTTATVRRTPEPPLADDDLLAAGALEYARRSREFAASAATVRSRRRHEPPPVDALLRFHARIYFKTMRALVGYRLAAAGLADRSADAMTCARQTLACIDRSRSALAAFPDGNERRALADLLDAIAHGIDARFPEARDLGTVFGRRAA